jgi:hypothetical protein
MRSQPTPELEAENMAYVWIEHCLREHAVEVAKGREYMSDSIWEEIQWTYERLRIAVEHHKMLETARLENKK